jgi:hypothetical protein
MLAAGACGTDDGGLGPSGERTRRSSGNAGELAVEQGSPAPAPTPPAPAPTAPTPAPTAPTPAPTAPTPAPTTPVADPGNATVVIRAEKLDARRIVARLIHAEKIEAESSSVADLRKDDGKRWETEGARGEQSFDDLRADTIYCKEIRTVQLEAGQVFVKDMKIKGAGKDEGDEKDD